MTVGVWAANEHLVSNNPREANCEASLRTLSAQKHIDCRGHASISTTEINTKVSDNSLIAAIESSDTLAQVYP